MADRTYYGLLEFEKEHLKKVSEKPANLPGSGVTAADLVKCQQRARIWVFQKLVPQVGVGYAKTLDAAWTLEASTYPDVVPTDIREIAKLVGSSRAWTMVEVFHGREKQQDDRKKQTRLLNSVRLLQDAEALWGDVVAAGVLILDDMSTVDLTASGSPWPLGIAAPMGDTTFFPSNDQTPVHGTIPTFGAERTFKRLEGGK